jgi:hypothetical protein
MFRRSIRMRIKHLIVIILIIAILYATCTASEGFVDAQRCGVDLPSCSSGLRCINGYCKTDIAQVLPYFSDLLITPDRH